MLFNTFNTTIISSQLLKCQVDKTDNAFPPASPDSSSSARPKPPIRPQLHTGVSLIISLPWITSMFYPCVHVWFTTWMRDSQHVVRFIHNTNSHNIENYNGKGKKFENIISIFLKPYYKSIKSYCLYFTQIYCVTTKNESVTWLT